MKTLALVVFLDSSHRHAYFPYRISSRETKIQDMATSSQKFLVPLS